MVPVIAKQIRLQGCLNDNRQDQIDFVEFFSAYGIKPVIDRAFPLEQLADAFRHQEAGQHFGKIAIET